MRSACPKSQVERTWGAGGRAWPYSAARPTARQLEQVHHTTTMAPSHYMTAMAPCMGGGHTILARRTSQSVHACSAPGRATSRAAPTSQPQASATSATPSRYLA